MNEFKGLLYRCVKPSRCGQEGSLVGCLVMNFIEALSVDNSFEYEAQLHKTVT